MTRAAYFTFSTARFFSARSHWPRRELMSSGLEDFSLFELFRMEAEEQVRVLQARLIELESGDTRAATLEALMRASHSLKGAARIVGLDVIVHLTHAMEDRFVAAQTGDALSSTDIDLMLAATDWLAKLQAATEGETSTWLQSNTVAIESCAQNLRSAPPQDAPQESSDTAPAEPQTNPSPSPAPSSTWEPDSQAPSSVPPVPAAEKSATEPGDDIFAPHQQEQRGSRERSVRMAADRFDHVVSLSAETMVAARQFTECAETLERNRRLMAKALHVIEDTESPPNERAAAQRDLEAYVAALSAHLSEFDQVARTNEQTTLQLFHTALTGRLRPFSEGITGVARLARDTSRELGKHVRLEVLGEKTRIDRDILEKLEAPISHLITNAIDHGIEAPADRLGASKPPEATLRLHALHENGRLLVTVRDDGHGIDVDRVRQRVIDRKLATPETASRLSDPELLEFLFLPGFSTREATSVYSGRGVGLNVVQSMVQEAGGSVTVTSTPGEGTAFRLKLPVTRSVARTIRVAVAGEMFAVPMVRIDRLACVELEEHEGKPIAVCEGRKYPVVEIAPLLGLGNGIMHSGAVPLLLMWGIRICCRPPCRPGEPSGTPARSTPRKNSWRERCVDRRKRKPTADSRYGRPNPDCVRLFCDNRFI